MAKLSGHNATSEESTSDSSRASWKTSRHSTKKHLNYGQRLSLALAATAAGTVILLILILASVWVFGPTNLLAQTDETFRDNLSGAILTAATLAVIIASFFGSRFARTFAKPVNRVTSTAAQIRSGDLSARTGIVGEDEVGRLGETFDSMAERVEKDVKLERRLTSDVAHELRTPLMAMLATVEAMQDGVLPADSEHLGVVHDEVKRLSRLVDAMLQLSRLENGTAPFDPQETEMVTLVSGIVSAQEQLFADKDIRLRFEADVSRKECYAEVDRDLVRQAITNFLSNALRYTPEGGWVLVKVSQDRQDVLISVQDTGIGIAKEELSRVFSRFWRSEASRVQESGGLGVGLAVSKEIADRHHGHISVESEIDKGTTFTLHLPRTGRSRDKNSTKAEQKTSAEQQSRAAEQQDILTEQESFVAEQESLLTEQENLHTERHISQANKGEDSNESSTAS